MPASFFLIMAGMAATGPGGMSQSPLYVTSQRSGEAVEFQLRGISAVPFEGNYELEVVSGPEGRGNRSLSRGKVRLEPGQDVRLASVTVRPGVEGTCQARLKVEGGGRSYSETSICP